MVFKIEKSKGFITNVLRRYEAIVQIQKHITDPKVTQI